MLSGVEVYIEIGIPRYIFYSVKYESLQVFFRPLLDVVSSFNGGGETISRPEAQQSSKDLADVISFRFSSSSTVLPLFSPFLSLHSYTLLFLMALLLEANQVFDVR
jgi:hypothetical protein